MSPRSNLTKQTVVQAAADLINAEGLEALSLGRLAKELGIRTPSLYNHVDGLPGLMRELSILNARNLADHISEAAIGQSRPEAGYARLYQRVTGTIPVHCASFGDTSGSRPGTGTGRSAQRQSRDSFNVCLWSAG